MNILTPFLSITIALFTLTYVSAEPTEKAPHTDNMKKTNEEWRCLLTPEQYHITREKGTERPFENAYHNLKKTGTYICVSCKTPLYSSTGKYDSGTGWPSFTQPITENAVYEKEDLSAGMKRVEILCTTCDAHLGHVFTDGPPPAGLRYCMNSAALEFIPEKKTPEDNQEVEK